jgi:hypothetical protein
MAVYLVSFISFHRHLLGRLLNRAIQISVGGKCLLILLFYLIKFASLPQTHTCLVSMYFCYFISKVNCKKPVHISNF